MHLPPRWIVVVSAAVAAAILGDSLLYTALPTVWPELGLDVGMVGVLLSVNRFVRLLSNSVAGWTVARFGVRRPFLAAVFVAAATTWVYAAGWSVLALLGARALWGICWSFLRLGGYLAALDAGGGHTGYYLGFFNGVTRFGSFIAALLGGLLTDLIGFHGTVKLFAGVTLLTGFVVWRERPPRDAAPTKPLPGESPAPVQLPEAAPVGAGLRLRLWTLFAMVFLQGMAWSGIVTATLGLWLSTRYGSAVPLGPWLVGVASLTGMLLAGRFLGDFLWLPAAGCLADRFDPRRVLLVAGAVEVTALVAFSVSGSLGWTVAIALVLFLAAPALQVSLDAQAGTVMPPERRVRTLSWYTTWLDLGAAAGPLAGYLLGAGIGLEWVYRGAALLLAMSGAVYIVVFRARMPAVAEKQTR